MSALKKTLLSRIADGVEKIIPTFDENSGRFLSKPAGPIAPGAREEDLNWNVTNQDVMYALATAYVAPDNPLYGDSRVLEMALRAADAVRDFQYPDGKVEFIKDDGSKWGPTYMGWTNYAWLETYRLLYDRLDAGRRQNWEEGLILAHDGQMAEIATLHVHNIPCWKAMSCYRAGELFDRADWQKAGRDLIHAALAVQHPDGFWPEHHGPTTLYNLVYVQALGMYHIYSGDESVLPALQAAMRFHETFTYPDGTGVETVDGRVKYRPFITPFGLCSFSLFPEGRRYVRYLLEQKHLERKDLFAHTASSFVDAFHHFQEGDETPIFLDSPSGTRVHGECGLVSREGPWFAALSAFTTPVVESRWGMDRQAFFSLWHEDYGLVVGGGNSKADPLWSSFAAGGRFVPDRGEIIGDGEGVSLHYGEVMCTLRPVLAADTTRLEVAAAGGPANHQMILPIAAGTILRTAAGQTAQAGEAAVKWSGEQLGEWIEIGTCRITLPPGACFTWPVTPFNPYAIDGRPPFGSEKGHLSAIVYENPITWTFQVNSRS